MSTSRVRYLAKRAVEVFREQGPLALVSRSIVYVYLHVIRPVLPAGDYPTVNGVVVGSPEHRYHTLDSLVPISTPSNPDWDTSMDRYKAINVDLLEGHTRTGDAVIVIGGGFGVTTVRAARAVGPDGSVTAYEGSSIRYEVLKRTIRLNDVDNVSAHHAIVGPAIDVAGPASDATAIDPGDLPEADVLEMDCEGAELDVLGDLTIRPRRVIVETHPNNGSSTAAVTTALEELGYDVVAERPDPGDGSILVGAPRE